jgi:hypothetical protein
MSSRPEWITVMERERRDPHDVSKLDRKQGNSVGYELFSQKLRYRTVKLNALRRNFNSEFPAACDAQVTALFCNQTAGIPGEFGVIFNPPEEGMSIQQNRHYS